VDRSQAERSGKMEVAGAAARFGGREASVIDCWRDADLVARIDPWPRAVDDTLGDPCTGEVAIFCNDPWRAEIRDA
jgi:hypothetical protein